MHDQLAALRWVQVFQFVKPPKLQPDWAKDIQEHIEEFGGDPSLVTLGGISAGAASTHYLLLSKVVVWSILDN